MRNSVYDKIIIIAEKSQNTRKELAKRCVDQLATIIKCMIELIGKISKARCAVETSSTVHICSQLDSSDMRNLPGN